MSHSLGLHKHLLATIAHFDDEDTVAVVLCGVVDSEDKIA